MAQSPVIETERLQIVSFSEEHLTRRYVSWLNDPEVVRYSDQRHRQHTLASCREYWRSFAGTPNYFWAIVARHAELRHIGNINAYVDSAHLLADVGILIGERAVWGSGYGTEAWIAICSYLFEELKLRKITAGTISSNKQMLKLMEKVGMIEDGRRIRQYLWEGKEVDIIYRAIFSRKWIYS
jgi:RimJ/RimL family protein N-acetyltransferase